MKEIDQLRQENSQQATELDMVKWYITVFEDGKDTREIVRLYSLLKIDHDRM